MTKDQVAMDYAAIAKELEATLKLKAIPFAMKLFEDATALDAIKGIRRPKAVHTLDQLVGQTARLGWTLGVTAQDLATDQCRAVIGLGGAKTETWYGGEHMKGVWFKTQEDAERHQRAMACVPDGAYQALAIAPLASGRLDPPDIALFYATPGAMIYFINGLQWSGYKRLDFSVVGESACADSWGRALSRKEVSLAIPCYAERRYGGVLDEEMLLAAPLADIVKGLEGMRALSANGLRYPFPPYGIQQDAQSGLAASYGGKG